MVGNLAARLEQQPDDVEGWAQLGRSYMVLNEPQKARDAYAHALKLKPDDAALKEAYAEASRATGNHLARCRLNRGCVLYINSLRFTRLHPTSIGRGFSLRMSRPRDRSSPSRVSCGGPFPGTGRPLRTNAKRRKLIDQQEGAGPRSNSHKC